MRRRRNEILWSIVCSFAAFSGCKKAPSGTSVHPVSHYDRKENKNRAVVFVHGIFGDAKDTWTCLANGSYWPQLILKDAAFDDLDVYVAAYDSPYWGNTMTIDEIVSNLNQHLQNDKVFAHREVVFVAHSLGGLIVQRLLLTRRDLAKQVPFIFFFSTPEEGSQLAQLASIFNADPLLNQMFAGDRNGYLLNLENEWIEAGFGIKRFCAYEKKPTKGVMVVSRLSGTRNCTAQAPIPINEDHLGIVKPCSPQDDSYIALRNAILATPIMTHPVPSEPNTVIANHGPRGVTEKQVEDALRKAVAEMTKKAQAGRPTNAELKSKARELSENLRKVQRIYNEGETGFSNLYQERIRAAQRAGHKDEAVRLFREQSSEQISLHDSLQMQFGPLRGQAINLERDLLERLAPQKAPDSQIGIVQRRLVRDLLDSGFVAGADPLFLLADYVDMLADQLR